MRTRSRYNIIKYKKTIKFHIFVKIFLRKLTKTDIYFGLKINLIFRGTFQGEEQLSLMDGILANAVSDTMVDAVTLGTDGTLETAIKLMNAGERDSSVITEGGDPGSILTRRNVIRLVAQVWISRMFRLKA